MILSPERFPCVTAGLPGIGGVHKQTADDFLVEEELSYTPRGTGDHVYLWIEKRDITTMDAARLVAAHLNVRSASIGYAGLKDARALARQWLSAEHVREEDALRLQTPELRVLRAERHGNKIRVGHLRGNRFEIRLRELPDPAAAAIMAQRTLDRLLAAGCPNYYTAQRFGMHGDNAAYGRALLDDLHGRLDPQRAMQQGVDIERLHRTPRKIQQLWLSALQSELFNAVLAERLRQDCMHRLLPGDLAFLHRNGAVFAVPDPAIEQPRCDAFEISPSGPMLGHKMAETAGDAAALEAAVFMRAGMAKGDFDCGHGLSQQGERRALRFRVAEACVTAEPDALRLAFSLPKGCYATAVLREICKSEHGDADSAGPLST